MEVVDHQGYGSKQAEFVSKIKKATLDFCGNAYVLNDPVFYLLPLRRCQNIYPSYL